MVFTKSGNANWVNNDVHVWDSMDSVNAENKGENSKGVILYDIQCNMATDFIGTVISVLYDLRYVDRFHMKPIVTVHNVLYEEKPIYGAAQFLEHYFKLYIEFVQMI